MALGLIEIGIGLLLLAFFVVVIIALIRNMMLKNASNKPIKEHIVTGETPIIQDKTIVQPLPKQHIPQEKPSEKEESTPKEKPMEKEELKEKNINSIANKNYMTFIQDVAKGIKKKKILHDKETATVKETLKPMQAMEIAEDMKGDHDRLWAVDEHGRPTMKNRADEKIDIQSYWNAKLNSINFIVGICALILMVLLMVGM